MTGIKGSVIEKILVNLVLTARANLPGADGKEQEDWIAKHVAGQVEKYDDLIPGLKAYADLPFVDELQRQGEGYLIKFCIRKAYAWAVAHKALPDSEPKEAAESEATDKDREVAAALGVSADEVLTPVKPTGGAESDDEEDDEGDEPDYEGILSEYATGGGWYTFPGKDGGDEVKQQGKEAALAYLKTRTDLLFEDEGGEE